MYIFMHNNLNSINSNEQSEQRWWLLERIRQSNKKILAPIIASASLWWTPALITTSWAAIATTLSSCNPDEPDKPTPPTPDIPDIPEWELISWLENLKNLELRVDQEVNLLNWIIFWEWVSYKVKIEKDWQITEITDPKHYIPNDPWKAYIIIIATKNGKEKTERIEKDIKPIEFKSMEISNYRPEEILPIIWQVEIWDPNAYNYIEHLWIAESTLIRDMMRKYWAGEYSPAEYQQLMSRLHTGMTDETPKWYDNYETIWTITHTPSDHAHKERHTLNTLIKHANFQIWETTWIDDVINMVQNHPNNIYIFWNSGFPEDNRSRYDWGITRINKRKTLSRSPNFIIFVAGTNIKQKNWALKNKILHEDIDENEVENWIYSLPSSTNGTNNSDPNNHLIVCIWTNSIWDIDQTNEIYETSKFPVWFHNNNLFAWRTFPAHSSKSWKIETETWKYATSYITYVDLAEACLCFQMHADVWDANELLNMIRTSSGLTDHIRFNWKDQQLLLPNNAWFFKSYNLPNDLPTQISSWEIIPLNKWFYKWVIFDMPWAEVYINGQWIAYNKVNQTTIKSQNPFHLEWRLNWDLCKKMWYNDSKTILWKIIAVDDNWKGLKNMSKTISIHVN